MGGGGGRTDLPLQLLRCLPPASPWSSLPGRGGPGRAVASPSEPTVLVCLPVSLPSVFSSHSLSPLLSFSAFSLFPPSLSSFLVLFFCLSTSCLCLGPLPCPPASPSPPTPTARYPLLCSSAFAAPPHHTCAALRPSSVPSLRSGPDVCEVSLCQLLPTALPPPSLLILPALTAFSFPLSAPPSFPLLSLEAPSAPSRLPWHAPSAPLPSTSISRLPFPSLCPLMVPITEPPATSSHTGLCLSPFPTGSQWPWVGITESSHLEFGAHQWGQDRT